LQQQKKTLISVGLTRPMHWSRS